jgi:hypothetical protein
MLVICKSSKRCWHIQSHINRYDLPPEERAKALPVRKVGGKKDSSKVNGVTTKYSKDDTPRGFARLMVFAKTGKGIRSGLDDGTRGTKRKRGNETEKEEETKPTTKDTDTENQTKLQIQPGERLADFSARVNQALPLSGVKAKGKKVEGIKDPLTKHAKRLKRMQEQWRQDDVKIREKEDEQKEVAEDEWEEKVSGLDREAQDLMITLKEGRKRNKKRKGKTLGEVDDGEDDPWAVLKTKRDKPKGIFDVAQAPPRFEQKPREIFKDHSVRDVPKSAGCLRKREDMGATRAEIIKSYREMMAAKRA